MAVGRVNVGGSSLGLNTKINMFVQSSQPTPVNKGDIWIDTPLLANTLYVYEYGKMPPQVAGAVWLSIYDVDLKFTIQKALQTFGSNKAEINVDYSSEQIFDTNIDGGKYVTLQNDFMQVYGYIGTARIWDSVNNKWVFPTSSKMWTGTAWKTLSLINNDYALFGVTTFVTTIYGPDGTVKKTLPANAVRMGAMGYAKDNRFVAIRYVSATVYYLDVYTEDYELIKSVLLTNVLKLYAYTKNAICIDSQDNLYYSTTNGIVRVNLNTDVQTVIISDLSAGASEYVRDMILDDENKRLYYVTTDDLITVVNLLTNTQSNLITNLYDTGLTLTYFGLNIDGVLYCQRGTGAVKVTFDKTGAPIATTTGSTSGYGGYLKYGKDGQILGRYGSTRVDIINPDNTVTPYVANGANFYYAVAFQLRTGEFYTHDNAVVVKLDSAGGVIWSKVMSDEARVGITQTFFPAQYPTYFR
jgi:hypothetical protein